MKKLLLVILIFSVFIAACNKKHNIFTVEGNINKINTDNKEICVNDTCVNVDNIKEYKVNDRVKITLESSNTSQDVYDPKLIKVLKIEKIGDF